MCDCSTRVTALLEYIKSASKGCGHYNTNKYKVTLFEWIDCQEVWYKTAQPLQGVSVHCEVQLKHNVTQQLKIWGVAPILFVVFI